MGSRWRVVARRVVVAAVLVAQLSFVVRAYFSDHDEFGFQMFPESSRWRADIVRVTDDGRRIPIDDPWDGYRWSALVTSRGLAYPGVEHHADAGLDNQLAFLDAALDYVADHTPRDTTTRYLEAVVTAWHNDDGPETIVLRSHDRSESP
jgi:hypothetical protein